MAGRDYKNTPRPRKRGARKKTQPSNLPGLVVIVLILALGIAIGLLGPRLLGIAGNQFEKLAPAPQDTTSAAEPTAQTPEQSPQETRFDFYEMLPDFQVIIPGKDKTVSTDASDKPVNEPGTYVLQVASFKSGESANALEARLALLGLRAHVQSVQISSGETWHRVRIGPVSNLEQLNQARETLAEHQFKPLLIELEAGQ